MEIDFVRKVETILKSYKADIKWDEYKEEMQLLWNNGMHTCHLSLEQVGEEHVLERKLYWSWFIRGIQERIQLMCK